MPRHAFTTCSFCQIQISPCRRPENDLNLSPFRDQNWGIVEKWLIFEPFFDKNNLKILAVALHGTSRSLSHFFQKTTRSETKPIFDQIPKNPKLGASLVARHGFEAGHFWSFFWPAYTDLNPSPSPRPRGLLPNFKVPKWPLKMAPLSQTRRSGPLAEEVLETLVDTRPNSARVDMRSNFGPRRP